MYYLQYKSKSDNKWHIMDCHPKKKALKHLLAEVDSKGYDARIIKHENLVKSQKNKLKKGK